MQRPVRIAETDNPAEAGELLGSIDSSGNDS
jgi:hypothetical protein